MLQLSANDFQYVNIIDMWNVECYCMMNTNGLGTQNHRLDMMDIFSDEGVNKRGMGKPTDMLMSFGSSTPHVSVHVCIFFHISSNDTLDFKDSSIFPPLFCI